MLCILRHRGIQLILAYSWARPAILVAGKSRGGGGCFYFFCFFTFIPVHSCSSLISSIPFLTFSGRGQKTRVDVSLNPNIINQSIAEYSKYCSHKVRNHIPLDMCTQQRFKSAYAFGKSDQNLH